ncbi:MAG: antibiotic biosynthesis monooxygenase [Ignavibacteriales bacterium]|nr:antibiotic biosynthesis monooxygenase [Ignavibacteriales bacterium]
MSTLIFSCKEQNVLIENSDYNNLYVMVKYKSQPEKQNEALSALSSLILEVKKSLNFVNIKVLVDPEDKTNIMLFEEWSDEAYYKGEHMKTPHLQQFIGDSRNFLAGPPDISFWKLNSNYIAD